MAAAQPIPPELRGDYSRLSRSCYRVAISLAHKYRPLLDEAIRLAVGDGIP
jgi:hypothetical protein